MSYRYHHTVPCKGLWLTEGESAETIGELGKMLNDHIENCDDCQEILSAPRWWDDASYIRYQSDCGEGYECLPLLFGGWWLDDPDFPEGPLRVSLINYNRQWKREAAARLAEYLPETDDIPF